MASSNTDPDLVTSHRRTNSDAFPKQRHLKTDLGVRHGPQVQNTISRDTEPEPERYALAMEEP